jgi:hypothetical protein
MPLCRITVDGVVRLEQRETRDEGHDVRRISVLLYIVIRSM